MEGGNVKPQYSYDMHTKEHQIKRISEVIQNAKQFFHHRNRLFSLFEIESYGSLDNITSMDIICRGYPPIYDVNFRQRGLTGDVVSSLKQLYECANTVKPSFDNALQRIAASVGLEVIADDAEQRREEDSGTSNMHSSVGLLLCPLKSLQKASEKVNRKYRHIDPGPPESWLYDVVRATFVCSSEEQICSVFEAIQEFPSFEVVRIRNRFTAPLVNGHRDIQLVLRLMVKNRLGHLVSFICEVCIVHESQVAYEQANPKFHELMQFFHPLLSGSVEKRESLFELMEHFVNGVDKRKKEERKSNKGEKSDLVSIASKIAARDYDRGQREAEKGHFDEDLMFTLENWVEFMTFLHLYDEAENIQKVVLRMVMKSIAGDNENHPDVAEALDTHAMLLKLQGKFSQAIASYEKNVSILSSVFGESHPKVANTLLRLAEVVQEQRKFSTARPLLEQALVIRKHAFGEYHPDVADSLTRLGDLCECQRQMDKAVEYYEKAIPVWKDSYGDVHPIVAESLSKMGNALEQLNDYPRAVSCFDEALSVLSAIYGKDSPHLDNAINSLAFCLKKQGELSQARPHFERLIDLRIAVHGEQHPAVATAINNLGLLLKKLTLYAEAKECYLRALSIRRKIYASQNGEHEDIASSLNNLALLYESMDNVPAALEHHEQALHIRRKVFGENHLLVAETLNNIGLAYKKANDLVKAKFHFEEALQIRLIYGSDTPNVRTTQNLIASVSGKSVSSNRLSGGLSESFSAHESKNTSIDRRIHLKVIGQEQHSLAMSLRSLAADLVQSGNAEAAAPLLEQSLHLLKLVFDDDSPVLTTSRSDSSSKSGVGKGMNEEIAKASICLARVLMLQCKYRAAGGLYLTANNILSAVFSPKDSRVLDNLLELSKVYVAQESCAEAKEVLENCLVLTQQIYGEENESVSNVLSELGLVHKLMKEFNASKRIYEKSLGIRIKIFGEAHSLVALSLSEIGLLMQAMRQYDDAMALHKQALAIRSKQFQTEAHTDIGISYRTIGAVHVECGRWPEAKDALEKAFHILRNTEGEDGVLLGGTLQEFAIVSLFCQVCSTRSFSAIGINDPGDSRALQIGSKGEVNVRNMSRLMKQQSVPFRSMDLDVAVPFLEKSLDIHLKSFGKLHPDTAFIYQEIGTVLRHYPREKVYERALAVLFLRQAYTIRSRLFSDIQHHPLVMESLCDLNELLIEESLWQQAHVTCSDLLQRQRDIASAIPANSSEGTFEGDSAQVVQSLLALSLINLRLNQLSEAKQLCIDCYDMCSRVFGQHSIETSCTLTLLGEIRSSQHKPNKAKASHEEALIIRKKLYQEKRDSSFSRRKGRRDSTAINATSMFGDFSILNGRKVPLATLLAESHESLAELRLESSKLDKARSHYDSALAIRRMEGNDAPDVMMALILGDTANLLCAQERYIEAKAIMLESLRVRRLVCRSDMPLIADALVQLSTINVALEEYDEALLFLEEALNMRKESFPAHSKQVANVYEAMARVFSAAQDTAQAHSLLVMALKTHKLRLRSESSSDSTALNDSEDIANTYVELGMIYFCGDQFEAACPFFEEALNIYLRLTEVDKSLIPPCLLKLAFAEKKRGHLELSRQRYQQAIAILNNIHKRSQGVHLDLATAYSSLSSLCFFEGKFQESLEYCQKALHIRKTLLGSNHEEVISTMWNLANICNKLGRHKESLDKVMAVFNWRKRYIESNFDVVLEGETESKERKEDDVPVEMLRALFECLVLLAGLHRKLSRLQESLEYNRQALSVLRRISTRENVDPAKGSNKELLDRLTFEADVLRLMNQFAEAESVMRRVLTLHQDTHPDQQNLDAALYKFSLATVLQKRGKLDEALEMFQSVLEIQRDILGTSDNSAIANTHNSVGVLLVGKDKFDEAEEHFQKALTIRRNLYGRFHAEVAASLNNLAGLYDIKGEYGDAKPLYEEALAIRRKLFPKGHPAVTQTMNNLAQLQVSCGDYSAAEKLFRECLKELTHCFGPNHPDVASCLNNLAGSLELSGKMGLEESLKHYREALRIRKEVFGEEHVSTAQCLNNMAGVYYKMQDFESAIQLYKQSIEIKTKVLGAESTDIAESRNNIAMLHMAAGAFVSAVHCQEEAVSLMERQLGRDHPKTINVMGNLGIIYRRMGVEKGDGLVASALQYLKSKKYPETHPWVVKFMAEGIDPDDAEEMPPMNRQSSSSPRQKQASVRRRKPQHVELHEDNDEEDHEDDDHEDEDLRSLASEYTCELEGGLSRAQSLASQVSVLKQIDEDHSVDTSSTASARYSINSSKSKQSPTSRGSRVVPRVMLGATERMKAMEDSEARDDEEVSIKVRLSRRTREPRSRFDKPSSSNMDASSRGMIRISPRPSLSESDSETEGSQDSGESFDMHTTLSKLPRQDTKPISPSSHRQKIRIKRSASNGSSTSTSSSDSDSGGGFYQGGEEPSLSLSQYLRESESSEMSFS